MIKRIIKQFVWVVMGLLVLWTVFGAVVQRNNTKNELRQNRMQFTVWGLSTGSVIADMNSGGINYLKTAKDMSGNTYVTTATTWTFIPWTAVDTGFNNTGSDVIIPSEKAVYNYIASNPYLRLTGYTETDPIFMANSWDYATIDYVTGLAWNWLTYIWGDFVVWDDSIDSDISLKANQTWVNFTIWWIINPFLTTSVISDVVNLYWVTSLNTSSEWIIQILPRDGNQGISFIDTNWIEIHDDMASIWFYYQSDYSSLWITNPRRIPDFGTVTWYVANPVWDIVLDNSALVITGWDAPFRFALSWWLVEAQYYTWGDWATAVIYTMP